MLEQISVEDRVPGISVEGGKVVGVDYTLGMRLVFGEDVFLPAFEEELLDRAVRSRRDLLGIVAGVWLPLWFFLSFVVPAKLLVQRLSASGLGWDEVIPLKGKEKFEAWRNDLKNIKNFQVNHWIRWKPGWQAQLHVFGDAAMEG